MNLERSRGTRDFLPEEQIVKQEILDKLRLVFELYGYSPLDSPGLERLDVLSSKYAGGSGILKEIFSLKDQGGRELGLRYDLTVPLARIVAMNPNLKLPFKRYHIGEVWRDGPVASARYRQFTQCDADIVGCASMAADAEVLCLARRVFDLLNLDVKIKVSNRKLLNDVLSKFGVAQAKHMDAILSLDKLEKSGRAVVDRELLEKGLNQDQVDSVIGCLCFTGGNKEKLAHVQKIVGDSETINDIKELFSMLDAFKADVEFDPSLARGLTYYTGTIFEVLMQRSEVKSSVAGGGRYDKIIGQFMGKEGFPAVGISFGVDRIYDAYLENHKAGKKTVADVYVIPIKTFSYSFIVAEELRSSGIKVDIDLLQRGPSKNLQYANALKIPY
ncbi:MAG: histidine--tRNA ligase, partial [Candidatus Woesearchaeota archaeon]